jgi:hypothetical protein
MDVKLNEIAAATSLALGLEPVKVISIDELRAKIAAFINDLVNHDFNRLVSILYRIDVDEQKLKNLLESYPGQDAAPIIADLVIQRQLQKIEARNRFRQGGENTIDENEKW